MEVRRQDEGLAEHPVDHGGHLGLGLAGQLLLARRQVVPGGEGPVEILQGAVVPAGADVVAAAHPPRRVLEAVRVEGGQDVEVELRHDPRHPLVPRPAHLQEVPGEGEEELAAHRLVAVHVRHQLHHRLQQAPLLLHPLGDLDDDQVAALHRLTQLIQL